MSASERVRVLERMHSILQRRAAAITDLIVAEAGAVVANARARQFETPMKHFRRFLELAQRTEVRALAPELTAAAGGSTALGTGFVVRHPVGVVVAITPYNFPFFLNLVKVAPALVSGNSVVLKPAPQTPFEALAIAAAAHEAGLPAGVLNVVTGGIGVGEALTRDPRVDLVSFTGSDAVGARIAAQCATTLKRVLLELGGKSALIVRADANVKLALSQALRGFTSHAGQGCALNTRVLVHESLYDVFVAALADLTARVRVGDPADPASEMGPLIDAVARERTERYVARGLDDGARLLSGGRRPSTLLRGFYFEPTLFGTVDPDSALAQDEIFGPVGVVMPFRDDEQAIVLANRSRYGLRGGIVSADLGAAYRMALRLDTGGVTLNGGAGTQLSDGPFGGIKRSGYGRELGEQGLDEFTYQKLIEIQAG
jgi:acyl-CoA reductase-like NAD-dependent aldehyde dehydrogenase